jgi:hypothetical protein
MSETRTLLEEIRQTWWRWLAPHWEVDERTDKIFYRGPAVYRGDSKSAPVDRLGRVHDEIVLVHAAKDAYELVAHPAMKRHYSAEFVVPLYRPDGEPYRTDVFRVDFDAAQRDFDWGGEYIAKSNLSDGRDVTLRLPMRAWAKRDHVRVTHPPAVVDAAAISPPAPALPPPDTSGPDALKGAASAVSSAARALTDAAQTVAAQRPRKATATRGDDGSLTVVYDS